MRREPFHEGEIAVQTRTGERASARRNGLGISSQIADVALPFLARQRLLAVTATGNDDGVWTSLWCGEPGFVTSADGQRVTINLALTALSADDPVLPRLAIGRNIGMLAIQLETRRRLRINGTVEAVLADEIRIVVRESVGNCPRYIQRRSPADIPGLQRGSRGESGFSIDETRRALIERVDTAFVGSIHPERGADASHRGGASGFIKVIDTSTIRVPDYPGNGMFMTLGNFATDPRASLAAIDFDRGLAVSFSGSARLQFGIEDPRRPTGGTGRYWDLAVREWVQFDLPHEIRWELLDASPFNPPAGR